MLRCENCFSELQNEEDVCPACGHRKGQPAAELYHIFPGTELKNRYRIGQVLGFGGFGITYKAWDKQLDTVVAIKEYYPSGLVNRIPGKKEVILFAGNRFKEYNMGLTRFLDEARNMAKFHNHPNIVNIFEFFEENNTAYIVMEFLDGITLNDFLKTNELDFDSCIEITQKVCAALAEIHSQKIIHRDVSPDNIFLCLNDNVKLIDFGAARFSADEERKMTIILKPGFAPPEQYDSVNQQGPWTDIYALGATLYFMLTKVKPDESTNRKIADKVKSPSELNADISEQVSNTVMKAMALDYHFRFTTIRDFSEALLGNRRVSTLSQEKKRRKNRRLFGILTALFALVLCASVLFTGIVHQRSNAVLPDVSITFYYPDSSLNPDALEEIISQFKSSYDNVDIMPVPISAASYGQMNSIFQKATIFVCDSLSDTVINQYADDASGVWALTDTADYSGMSIYLAQKTHPYRNTKIPLGFVVPVQYTKKSAISEQETSTIEDFMGTDCGIYFGTNLDYLFIQKHLAGKYQIKAVKDQNGYFTNAVSINKYASEDEKTVAARFIAFLLSDYVQETLYVLHGNGVIPVNDSAAQVFADVYSELAMVIPVTSYCEVK